MAKRSDQEKLDLFIQAVNELKDRRGLRDGTILTTMTIGAAGHLAPQYDSGDVEDLRSVMLAFRGFVAQGEDTYVPTVCAATTSLTADASTRQVIARLQDEWAELLAISMLLNGASVSAVEAFRLVAYGEVFHKDASKIETLTALGELRPVVDFLCTTAIVKGVRLLSVLRDVVIEVRAGRAVRGNDLTTATTTR
ncbi:hypothetical protein [Actinomadura luteofluorescens]